MLGQTDGLRASWERNPVLLRVLLSRRGLAQDGTVQLGSPCGDWSLLKFCAYLHYNAKLCLNGHESPN
jgi:hypothetical protein